MSSKMEKELQKYLDLPYTLMLRRDEDGDFIARIKELPGCIADGQDEMEAIAHIEEMKRLWIDSAMKNRQAIPLPEEEQDLPSGKWLTRVPRSLHKKLIDLAEAEGVSLNQLVVAGLAEMVGKRQHTTSNAQTERYSAYGSACAKTRLQIVSSDGERVTDEAQGLALLEGLAASQAPEGRVSLRERRFAGGY